MRIISGNLKGKSINFVKNSTTRPLKDLVKENIFNILKHSKLIDVEVENANVLDLYSGIGSFGLECISRGAKNVTFVEQNKNALDILKKNLNQLSIISYAKIVENKIENIFREENKKGFDIFFLDPPFKDVKFIENLNMIKKNKIHKNEHIVIIHREKNSNDVLSNVIDIIITKQYGRSKILFGVFK